MNAKSKLLLVDDEVAITDRLAPFLSRAGFEVSVVADGETALREIISFSPDLIIFELLTQPTDPNQPKNENYLDRIISGNWLNAQSPRNFSRIVNRFPEFNTSHNHPGRYSCTSTFPILSIHYVVSLAYIPLFRYKCKYAVFRVPR